MNVLHKEALQISHCSKIDPPSNGRFFCEGLLNFFFTADSLPEASDEAGDDAALQCSSTAGSV